MECCRVGTLRQVKSETLSNGARGDREGRGVALLSDAAGILARLDSSSQPLIGKERTCTAGPPFHYPACHSPT